MESRFVWSVNCKLQLTFAFIKFCNCLQTMLFGYICLHVYSPYPLMWISTGGSRLFQYHVCEATWYTDVGNGNELGQAGRQSQQQEAHLVKGMTQNYSPQSFRFIGIPNEVPSSKGLDCHWDREKFCEILSWNAMIKGNLLESDTRKLKCHN